jgi:hypothetical protein
MTMVRVSRAPLAGTLIEVWSACSCSVQDEGLTRVFLRAAVLDSGSCYYYDTKNFMVYGGYKNYMGHSKVVVDNIYVHPEWRAGSCGPAASLGMCVQDVGVTENSGWGEIWRNNTCIFGGAPTNAANLFLGDYSTGDVHLLNAGDNTYLAPGAPTLNVTMTFGAHTKAPLTVAQTAGMDIGSTVGPNPTADEVVAMGKTLLGMQKL